jgi:glycosyltransferase involved in cell wall biosynthesis
MGLEITILANCAGDEVDDSSVYDIQKAREARSKTRRLLDGLYFRVAPRWTETYVNRRSLSTAVQCAVAERGVQIIEIEDTFGFAEWVRQAASVHVCVRLHGPWFLNGPALGVPEDEKFHERVRQERTGILAADAITAPSQDVLQRVRDFYHIALPDAEVIPNPILPVPRAERWRLEDCDPNQVLFIGRFDRHKGGDLIIEAFARVLQEVPEARLRFVGPDQRGCVANDGRHWNIENFIRDRIPGALETGRVEWLKQQPHSALADLRRKSMVSVVCSRYENLPYTAIEAMAMGCPTVGAKTGGISEIFEEGVNGFLHRAGDSEDLAAKIIHLLRNPDLTAQVGRQAATDCEQRFYPDAVAGRMIDFYRRMLTK